MPKAPRVHGDHQVSRPVPMSRQSPPPGVTDERADIRRSNVGLTTRQS